MSNSIEYQKISQSSDESQESSEEMNVNVSNIPSSQSSAQLIRNNLGNSESVLNESGTINDDDKERRSRLGSVSSRNGYRDVSSKEWFTVAVLCFINLINYMDRFTIAGKNHNLIHFPFAKKNLHHSIALHLNGANVFEHFSSLILSFSRDFDFDVFCVVCIPLNQKKIAVHTTFSVDRTMFHRK